MKQLGVLFLFAACAAHDPPLDCDSLVAHLAGIQVAERIAQAPERDREQHREALVGVLAPAMRDACAQASARKRACLGAATTATELATCGAIP